MDLVDSVEAGKLTIRELIDALVKDKNYTASQVGAAIPGIYDLATTNLNFC